MSVMVQPKARVLPDLSVIVNNRPSADHRNIRMKVAYRKNVEDNWYMELSFTRDCFFWIGRHFRFERDDRTIRIVKSTISDVNLHSMTDSDSRYWPYTATLSANKIGISNTEKISCFEVDVVSTKLDGVEVIEFVLPETFVIDYNEVEARKAKKKLIQPSIKESNKPIPRDAEVQVTITKEDIARYIIEQHDARETMEIIRLLMDNAKAKHGFQVMRS